MPIKDARDAVPGNDGLGKQDDNTRAHTDSDLYLKKKGERQEKRKSISRFDSVNSLERTNATEICLAALATCEFMARIWHTQNYPPSNQLFRLDIQYVYK